MNLCDQWLETFYGKYSFREYSLIDRCARALEQNKTGQREGRQYPWSPLPCLTPSDCYFNGIWNWDSAFHAMGIVQWDPELARDQVRLFLKIQKENGMFPDVWECSGDIKDGGSKPPVLPWAVCVIDHTVPDLEFVKECYPALKKNLEFWFERRRDPKSQLFHYDGEFDDPEKRQVWGGFESGWDNSARWDGGVYHQLAIDLNCYMILAYRAMRRLSARMRLAEDVSTWTRLETELTALVENGLWDENRGCYLDFDKARGAFNGVITPASFMPLFIGIALPAHAEKMNEIARVHFSPGWPSLSYHSPQFDPLGYWRGRTWLNVAYFALKGLKNYGFDEMAETGRDKILEWLYRLPVAPFENYHPQSGNPLGVPHFGWSAVFAIKFILNWNQPELLEKNEIESQK